MKIEITSTIPFGNSKYVTKGQTNGYRVLQLEKTVGDTDLRGIPQESGFYIGCKNAPRSGGNKFKKSPPYFENSPRSGGKRL